MKDILIASPLESISGVDTLWVLLGAMLVFWMQPGFALVEAGMTRSKNTANILMKNFCDFMCGSVLFWILGYSLMFGTDHGVAGWDGFFFRSNGGNDNPAPMGETTTCPYLLSSFSKPCSVPQPPPSSAVLWLSAPSFPTI